METTGLSACTLNSTVLDCLELRNLQGLHYFEWNAQSLGLGLRV